VNSLTRKQLKTDNFAKDVGLTLGFLGEHRADTIRYGLIALAVIVLGSGYFLYSRHAASVREEALAQAMRIDQAIIAPSPTATNLNFVTQAEKDKARTQVFADLATKYRGTVEGAIGGIYIGAEKADRGDLTSAEKIYKDVMDSAPEDLSSVARLSLAHIYQGENKLPDAEKLLRYLMDHPTRIVSKEEATLALADVLAKTNCTEALKLVEPLKISRTAVSLVALDESTRISATCKA
jgi:predicted negative regulator of RcsB-dependent stress response